MSNWTKKPVTRQQVEPLCQKYGIDRIAASILVRRGITEGKDILYYLEDDLRFQHSPYLFNSMEDAVERLLQAKDEGEKVLIFGDSDVDGITSTVILYECLKENGIDVQWRVPLGDDAYGLSLAAVDDFYAQGGTLIITVDCGISNYEEVRHANTLGIDVIITDHHNPPERLPEAIIILDPKTEDSGYPFPEISGAAVAYKLASALRFALTDFYNAEICLLDIQKDEKDGSWRLDAVRVRNMVRQKELHETVIPGKTTLYDLKLPEFLQGQLIYVWDSARSRRMLAEIFGTGVEFNLTDFGSQVCAVMPTLRGKTPEQLKGLSKIARYIDSEDTVLSSLFNLYVTYCNRLLRSKYPALDEAGQKALQLVALAALADVMPMKNENRIFVRNGITSIKKHRPRPGLAELMAEIQVNPETLTSVDLSWYIIPALNATGRLGQPDLAVRLLLSEHPQEREQLAHKIKELNETRKNMVAAASFKIHDLAAQSVRDHQEKLCVVVDESIQQGLTGLFAARLMQDFDVPAIALTFSDDICIGSIRSCRGFIATDFLDSFGDFFLNHGGHDCAAGFSFERGRLEEFLARVKAAVPAITLSGKDSGTEVDAEIPAGYMTPELFALLDMFEPYGAENPELVFMSPALEVCDALLVGKKEPSHLKLVFDCGAFKVPAMFWNEGSRLGKTVLKNGRYDILYRLGRNHYNGTTTNQIILSEIKQNEKEDFQ